MFLHHTCVYKVNLYIVKVILWKWNAGWPCIQNMQTHRQTNICIQT